MGAVHLNPELKPLSTNIADAKLAAEITITGAMILGYD
jgi:hypothetical protein